MTESSQASKDQGAGYRGILCTIFGTSYECITIYKIFLKQLNIDTHYNLDESQSNYAEWKKPVKKNTQYDFIYIKRWKV